MSGRFRPGRVATLVGEVPSPAFEGLARSLARLIADGRLPLGLRLPSERELATALGLSRTTVTRAYTVLREAGYAIARQGSGTWTQVPGGRRGAVIGPCSPVPDRTSVVDLTCAAAVAAPGLASAYATAVEQLPAYLTGHGYFPLGLPELREAIADGLHRTRAATPRPSRFWSPRARSAPWRRSRKPSSVRATGCSSSRRSTPTRWTPCVAREPGW